MAATGTAAALGVLKVAPELAYTHPAYQEREWWWRFFRLSYIGGREYLKPSDISIEFQYPTVTTRTEGAGTDAARVVEEIKVMSASYQRLLFRSDREKDWEFENRARQSYLVNIYAPTINALVSAAAQVAPKREGPSKLTKVWEAVDERGSKTMDEFMAAVFRWAAAVGIWWVCADKKPEVGARPYLYAVSPIDVLDYHLDEDGRLIWLKQVVLTEASRTYRTKVKTAAEFRIWDRSHVTIITADGVKAKRKHGADRVPWEPIYGRSVAAEGRTYPDGMPLLADGAKIQNAIFNLHSRWQQLIGDQVFSVFCVPDEGGKLSSIELGTNRAFGFTSKGGQPAYISPDPENPRVIMEGIGALLEQYRASCGIGRGRSEGSKQVQSADALELEGQDRVQILGDVATEMEDADTRASKLLLAYSGGGDEDAISVKYNRRFSNLQSLKAELEDATSLKNFGIPASVKGALGARMIRKAMPDAEPEEIKRLAADMEAHAETANERAPNVDPNADPDKADESAEPPAPDAKKPPGKKLSPPRG
jgi:hypothetical protein